MAACFTFVKPPDELLISGGNPAHTWQQWKRKFDIYLQATGASSKSDAIKIGLLLNHVGKQCLQVYTNFTYLPERPDPVGGEAPLPAENPDKYDTVIRKFDKYFTKQDPRLMLREKFWLHLKREPAQSFDS